MKLKLLFLLLILSSSSFAFLISNEKKLAIASDKYLYGYYEECILLSGKFATASFFSEKPEQASDAFALKSASYLRLADLHSYEKTITEWQLLLQKELVDSTKSLCLLKVAQLYLEVGNLKACDSILISIHENRSIENNKAALRSLLLFKLGNRSAALTGLNAAIEKAFRNSSDKKLYASLVSHLINGTIMQGDYDSAGVLISTHRTWLLRNFPSQYYIRELDRLSGELELSKGNFTQAYSFFYKAYQNNAFTDNEYQKIELLSASITLANRIGLTDQMQKLLRRLQMFASITGGKKEPFQYIYERTLLQLELDNNNFAAASQRLEKFYEYYHLLPAWHPVRLSFIESESDLLLYQKKLNVCDQLDKLIAEYQQALSPSHELIAKLRLKKISYTIYYGSGLNTITKDLSVLNENFISKGYTGNNLLSYLELCSTFYFLTDDFKSYAEYAEKAYAYSIKLFDKGSEKIMYYHADYLKSKIYSENYKTVITEFAQLKHTFNTANQANKEEIIKAYLILSEISNLIGEQNSNKSVLLKIINEMDEFTNENIYVKSKTEAQLAVIYYQAGNLYKAEKLIKKAIANKKSLLPNQSVSFIEDYFFLAMLELQLGNYKEAEKNLALAEEILTIVYGKTSRLYSEYLKIHSDYCASIGDYDRGKEYIGKSRQVLSVKAGKASLGMVSLLVREAYLLSQNNPDAIERKEAAILYTKSLQTLSSTIGTENAFYMDVLKKNAYFYIKTGQTDKADSLLSVAENYWKKYNENNTQELSEIYLLKGDISYEQDDYDKASSYYLNTKTIASKYGNKNSYYIRASAREAKVAFMKHQPEVALSIMETLLPKYMDVVSKNFPSLSFREKARYWNNMKDEFEFYIFLVLNHPEFTSKYSKDVFNYVIATKAILLSSSIKVRESIMASKDSLLINTYNDWISTKEYFISVSSLSKEEQESQKIDLRTIELEIEKKEKYLSSRSEIFKTEDKISNADFKDIVSILSKNEYAVELVRYRTFYKKFTDTINYTALIVSKDASSPEVVSFPKGNLFETKALKQVRNTARYHLKDNISYTTFWAPLQNKIPEGATVYLSSEGSYNLFNPEMLTDSTGKYLLDKIELVRVTNTRELMRSSYRTEKSKDKNSVPEVVLGGSPDFYFKDTTSYHSKLSDLPGTVKEIEQISALLSNSKVKVTKVMGEALTEDRVKEMNNPKIFHIATHGYYSENSTDDDEENNSMLNSGLLLCGSGSILSANNHINSKDGILTAYEAMNLRLDHTDLVVLSACETGLGEVKAGEGVYGLQRSFLISGSKAIILSLYKVNDEVTQQLMMEFYSNWIKNGDIRSSFIMAKQKIKNQYPEQPIYWGAFVLIEGQPQLRTISKNG